MREKLLLVGAGGFGRSTLEHASTVYECYFVDDCYPHKKEVCGIPIIACIEEIPQLFAAYTQLVVTIGNTHVREKIYEKAKRIGFSFPNIIAQSAYISPFSALGNGCVVLNNVVVQGGATIGNGVLLNPGVEIHHDSVVGDNTLIYSNSVVRTYAQIGKRAQIGSTVTIATNATVQDDGIVPDGTVWKYTNNIE